MNQYQIQLRACELESDREICVNSHPIGLLTKNIPESACNKLGLKTPGLSISFHQLNGN